MIGQVQPFFYFCARPPEFGEAALNEAGKWQCVE